MTEHSNLIVFQSDNHNRDLLGCSGHGVVRTPNLDRIAAQGTRFSNAYCASPLCCPSRASLATGQYPHQTGYWDNCLVYDGREPSWARRMREHGVLVESVGKLHYRSSEDDNGFARELAPMHIVDGVGGLVMLLRWSGEEPVQANQWRLYAEETGVGSSDYQDYDREITRLAIERLQEHAANRGRPFALYISYPSSHPPFSVPQRFWDMYPVDEMPLPLAFSEAERPTHPAYAHLRHIKGIEAMGSDQEQMLRRVAAGYFGLITHLDEQIGLVMDAARSLGLLESTRIVYTSDHGESFGNHGLFGKCQLRETAAAVPLLMSGPGIERGRVVEHPVSQIDLYQTLLESVGVPAAQADSRLPGRSLWPTLRGATEQRAVFGEYHASCSRSGSFFLRAGNDKLIYHVGMPRELFDLAEDSHELNDRLAGTPPPAALRCADELEALLRRVCDPEAVDAAARQDQRRRAEQFGGTEALRAMGAFTRTPPPGANAAMLPMG